MCTAGQGNQQQWGGTFCLSGTLLKSHWLKGILHIMILNLHHNMLLNVCVTINVTTIHEYGCFCLDECVKDSGPLDWS